jgi:hypothetical protein
MVRRANSVVVSRILSSLLRKIFVTVTTINTYDGNSAANGYGVVRGLWAARLFRLVAGLLEILSFPFPAWRESYYPMLPPDIPYIHAGYSEFPPELGNESKYPYVRIINLALASYSNPKRALGTRTSSLYILAQSSLILARARVANVQ